MKFAMQYVKAKSNMGSYIRKFAGLPIYKGGVGFRESLSNI